MKRRIFYVAAILWILAAIQIGVRYNIDREDKIVEAFNGIDFVKTQGNVEALVNYGSVYLEDGEKEKLVKDIAQKIGINDIYEYKLERNAQGTIATLSKSSQNAGTIIKLVTVETPKEDNVIELDQYIIVNLTLYNSIESAFSYKELIDKMFMDMKLKPEITVNFTGVYNGELDIVNRDVIVNQMLDEIDAKVMVENRTDELYSIYAYTSLVDDYTMVGKDKVNVNVGINYDETQNTTNFYLSTPIINEDY